MPPARRTKRATPRAKRAPRTGPARCTVKLLSSRSLPTRQVTDAGTGIRAGAGSATGGPGSRPARRKPSRSMERESTAGSAPPARADEERPGYPAGRAFAPASRKLRLEGSHRIAAVHALVLPHCGPGTQVAKELREGQRRFDGEGWRGNFHHGQREALVAFIDQLPLARPVGSDGHVVKAIDRGVEGGRRTQPSIAPDRERGARCGNPIDFGEEPRQVEPVQGL